MKQILFQVLEFQIVQGATFYDTQLAEPQANSTCMCVCRGGGGSGQLFISNTGVRKYTVITIYRSKRFFIWTYEQGLWYRQGSVKVKDL